MAATLEIRAAAEYGQHIFIYSHLQAHHVVYSLNRVMHNDSMMKQLPYLTKQTKPANLRKDLWRPLATVSFPTGFQGLAAYHRLREFRVRHEHEWEHADMGLPLHATKKEIGRKLRDQKANSIADLSAVLHYQEKQAMQEQSKAAIEQADIDLAVSNARARVSEIRKLKFAMDKAGLQTDDQWKTYRALKHEKIRLCQKLEMPVPHKALKGEYDLQNDRQIPAKRGIGRNRAKKPRPLMEVNGIRIAWADILDAEFAATWPKNIMHDVLERGSARTRNIPPTPDATENELQEETSVSLLTPVQQKPNAILAPPPGSSLKERIIERLKYGRS